MYFKSVEALGGLNDFTSSVRLVGFVNPALIATSFLAGFSRNQQSTVRIPLLYGESMWTLNLTMCSPNSPLCPSASDKMISCGGGTPNSSQTSKNSHKPTHDCAFAAGRRVFSMLGRTTSHGHAATSPPSISSDCPNEPGCFRPPVTYSIALRILHYIELLLVTWSRPCHDSWWLMELLSEVSALRVALKGNKRRQGFGLATFGFR